MYHAHVPADVGDARVGTGALAIDPGWRVVLAAFEAHGTIGDHTQLELDPGGAAVGPGGVDQAPAAGLEAQELEGDPLVIAHGTGGAEHDASGRDAQQEEDP